MKIICVGRNYVAHAKELDNDVPDEPLIFMKPASALVINNKPFFYPAFSNDIHHEIELVVKLSKNGKHIQPEFAGSYFQNVTVGIDLTARDIQAKCKKNGHPWEIAKAFDGSAIVGQWVDKENLSSFNFSLNKNKAEVQNGKIEDMIFTIEDIIVYVSKFFTLNVGDVIFTGTPEGVGPVAIGDHLEGFLDGQRLLSCMVK